MITSFARTLRGSLAALSFTPAVPRLARAASKRAASFGKATGKTPTQMAAPKESKASKPRLRVTHLARNEVASPPPAWCQPAKAPHVVAAVTAKTRLPSSPHSSSTQSTDKLRKASSILQQLPPNPIAAASATVAARAAARAAAGLDTASCKRVACTPSANGESFPLPYDLLDAQAEHGTAASFARSLARAKVFATKTYNACGTQSGELTALTKAVAFIRFLDPDKLTPVFSLPPSGYPATRGRPFASHLRHLQCCHRFQPQSRLVRPASSCENVWSKAPPRLRCTSPDRLPHAPVRPTQPLQPFDQLPPPPSRRDHRGTLRVHGAGGSRPL